MNLEQISQVKFVIENWASLDLAIQNSPYIPYEPVKEELTRHLLEYLNDGKPEALVIEDNLVEFVMSQLDCEIQDGSCQLISKLIMEIYSGKQVSTLLVPLQKSQLNTMELSDEDEKENQDMDVVEKPKKEDIIDEDGFILVKKKK